MGRKVWGQLGFTPSLIKTLQCTHIRKKDKPLAKGGADIPLGRFCFPRCPTGFWEQVSLWRSARKPLRWEHNSQPMDHPAEFARAPYALPGKNVLCWAASSLSLIPICVKLFQVPWSHINMLDRLQALPRTALLALGTTTFKNECAEPSFASS